MAQSFSDREIVNRLQRRVSLWKRKRHSWDCEYDAAGRLISINLKELGLSDVLPEITQFSNL